MSPLKIEPFGIITAKSIPSKYALKKLEIGEAQYRFFYLNWKIIEWKLMYYRPDLIAQKYHKELTIPDSEYDERCEEYLWLCLQLKKPNTVVHQWRASMDDKIAPISKNVMLEPDLKKPGVRLVLSKYGTNRAKQNFDYENYLPKRLK